MSFLKDRTTIIIGAAVIVLLVVVGYVTLTKEEEPEPSFKILFVGPSTIDWNKGFDFHLEILTSSADPSLIIQADKVIQYGTPLKGMWEETNAQSSIKKGGYDVVVIQEVLHWTFVETFHEYARKFDDAITEAGAETVLFMVYAIDAEAARTRASMVGDCLGYASMDVIDEAHQEIAEELDCKVSPFGLAFYRAKAERPALDLLERDKIHPNIYGTYLAINVVYATVFDRSPEGLTYWPDDISESDAKFLQQIAWETVQEYKAVVEG